MTEHPTVSDDSPVGRTDGPPDGPPDAPSAESTLTVTARVDRDEDGSLVTEYGLLAVVAATIAGVVIEWASNGAIVRLFNALLRSAREIVGA